MTENQKNKYAQVLESALPYIFFTQTFPNRDGLRQASLEFLNPSFCDILGISKITATHPYSSFEAFVKEIFLDQEAGEFYLASLEQKNRVADFEARLKKQDGTAFWVQAHSQLIPTEGGFYIQGIFSNLDHVKALEEELIKGKKTLEIILSGIGDSVCIYDRSCKIIFQSPRHKSIFGDSVGEMCLYSPAESKDAKAAIEKSRWLERKADEQGKERFYEITAFPITDEKGQIFAGINIVRDMTTRIELEAKEKELAQIQQVLKGQVTFENMVGRSASIRKVFDAIEAIAPLETTVLIEGETGVGKELVARAIHKRSHRSDKPFLGVNCGAIPETLLESELFGHLKGSFTGAGADKLGLFQAANSGTLFLDEISELSPGLQVKLLRVLQEGEIRRVGSTKDEKVDVRVITAGNKPLKDLVDAGKFRQDLFYRLHVFPIVVPPLHERKEDILLIAEHFLKFYSSRMKKKVSHFSRQVQEALENYPWPGNIRELSNIVERAVILAKKEVIIPDDLPLPRMVPDLEPEAKETGPLQESLEDISRKKILEVLAKHNGNKVKTAKDLGISRTTLWRRLRESSPRKKASS